MRAIVVSGGVLAVLAVFGLGVVVGRFILNDDQQAVSVPIPAVAGVSGLDDPLGDPNAVLSGDPSLNAMPPTAAGPLPPATPPARFQAKTDPNPITMSARSESDAAMAASALTAACNIRVEQPTNVRSWEQKDRLAIVVMGQDCAGATVRAMIETPDGAALHAVNLPARDFAIGAEDNAEAVRTKISAALPDASVRAAAFPTWAANQPAPAQSDFTQERYEALRSANAPVVCFNLPQSGRNCFALDGASGQVKLFSRG